MDPMKGIVAKLQADRRDTVFRGILRLSNLPEPVAELRFHPTRKWRLDYAWPDAKLGLEVEGGVWSGGKHGRGSGIVKDMEKANALACLGWRLLRVTPSALPTLETAHLVRAALEIAS
jgi:very-short-patch-repair endonuclease